MNIPSKHRLLKGAFYTMTPIIGFFWGAEVYSIFNPQPVENHPLASAQADQFINLRIDEPAKFSTESKAESDIQQSANDASVNKELKEKYQLSDNADFSTALEDENNQQDKDVLIRLWAEHDAKSAYEWLSSKDSDNYSVGLLADVLVKYAEKDWSEVQLELDRLSPLEKSEFVNAWAYKISEQSNSYDELVNQLSVSFTDAKDRDTAFSYLANGMSMNRPDQALKLMGNISREKLLESSDDIQMMGFFLSELANGQVTEEGIEAFDDNLHNQVVRGVVSNLVFNGSENAFLWVNSLSDGYLKNLAVDEFIRSDTGRILSPELYVELSTQVSDEKQQLSILVNAVESVMTNNQDALSIVDRIAQDSAISNNNKNLIRGLYGALQQDNTERSSNN